ncbi:hypothetical protein D9M71_377250 [compost metagenome]
MRRRPSGADFLSVDGALQYQSPFSHADEGRLHLHEFKQAVYAILAAIAALLVTAERHLHRRFKVGVNEHSATL